MLSAVTQFFYIYIYRKARKLFEKTAAPILYVAGIEVNVVPVSFFLLISILGFVILKFLHCACNFIVTVEKIYPYFGRLSKPQIS